MTYRPLARIYMRVSTDGQNLERQHQKLREEAQSKGFHVIHVYSDKKTGFTLDRPGFKALVNDLQPGEWIYLEDLDRLGRLDYEPFKQLLDDFDQKNINIYAPGLLDLSDVLRDVENPFFQDLLRMVQRVIRNQLLYRISETSKLMKQRQQEGIKIAKSKGLFTGRKARPDQHKIIEERLKGHSIRETALLTNYSLSQTKDIWASWRKKNPVQYKEWLAKHYPHLLAAGASDV